MNRALTMIFAAAQAVIVACVGIGIPLALGTLVWAIQDGFAGDFVVVWRTALDTWLLGHGVPIHIELPPATLAALGLDGAAGLDGFTLGLPLAGFLVLTVALGIRAGRRTAPLDHPVAGLVTTVAVFGAVAGLVGFAADHPVAQPSLWAAAAYPTAAWTVGVIVGWIVEVRGGRARAGLFAGALTRDSGALVRHVVAAALACLAALAGAAALIAGLALLTGFGEIVALYEALHAGVLGGVVLTGLQLALLPTFVVWSAAWIVGPGFAIGTGSAVAPIGTTLGPVPALPLLGAVPVETGPFSLAVMAVPVVIGLVIALAWRGRIAAATGHRMLPALGAGLAVVVLAAAGLAGLAVLASGAAGPGRLADVGPDPLTVGLWFAVELLLPVVIGIATGVRADAAASVRVRPVAAGRVVSAHTDAAADVAEPAAVPAPEDADDHDDNADHDDAADDDDDDGAADDRDDAAGDPDAPR